MQQFLGRIAKLIFSIFLVTYVLSGVAFLLVIILGAFISSTQVLDSSSKKRKEHASILFVATSFITTFSVFAVLVISAIYSTGIVDIDITNEVSNASNFAFNIATATMFLSDFFLFRGVVESHVISVIKAVLTVMPKMMEINVLNGLKKK